MSSTSGKKPEYSKKLLKLLAEKPAVAFPDIAHVGPENALKRSLRALHDAGLVEHHYSGQHEYIRLTSRGRARARSQSIDATNTLLNLTWDGKWRIILLDLPESRKDERDSLRYLLKKAGFLCLKNSVWISPFPYEHLFANIKKDFGFTTELMILVTDRIDTETERAFFELAKLAQ